MMIRTPNIDEPIKTPCEFVKMVGDIGCQVRIITILLTHHTIFLIFELGGSKPQGSIFFEHQVTLF